MKQKIFGLKHLFDGNLFRKRQQLRLEEKHIFVKLIKKNYFLRISILPILQSMN